MVQDVVMVMVGVGLSQAGRQAGACVLVYLYACVCGVTKSVRRVVQCVYIWEMGFKSAPSWLVGIVG